MKQRGIVKLSDILPIGLLADMVKPAAPAQEVKAPATKPPRVIGDPTRTPVNLQAARMTMKAGYLYQPPVQPLPPQRPVVEVLREEIARLTLVNENLVKTNAVLTRRVERLKILAEKNQAPAIAAPIPAIGNAVSKCEKQKRELLERLKS